MNRHLVVVVASLIADTALAMKLVWNPGFSFKGVFKYLITATVVNMLISLLELWTR